MDLDQAIQRAEIAEAQEKRPARQRPTHEERRQRSANKAAAGNLAVKVAALSLELSELDKRAGEFAAEFCRNVLMGPNFTNAKGSRYAAAQPAAKHHGKGVAARNVEDSTGPTASGHSRDAIRRQWRATLAALLAADCAA